MKTVSILILGKLKKDLRRAVIDSFSDGETACQVTYEPEYKPALELIKTRPLIPDILIITGLTISKTETVDRVAWNISIISMTMGRGVLPLTLVMYEGNNRPFGLQFERSQAQFIRKTKGLELFRNSLAQMRQTQLIRRSPRRMLGHCAAA